MGQGIACSTISLEYQECAECNSLDCHNEQIPMLGLETKKSDGYDEYTDAEGADEYYDEYASGEVAGNSVELIYGDFLGDKWTDYSYKGKYHYDESSEVYEGTHAIRADYRKWGGLQVADNNDLNSEGITSLSFFIKVTGTSTDPMLVWVDDKKRRINPKNNEWEHVILPLSLFESPSTISRVVFQNDSGEARTVYFDRIEFISNPTVGSHAGTTPMATDGPTDEYS
jgi:hypothetical protein